MPASADQHATLLATATAFTMMGVGIALLQSDMIGRKILSIEELLKKRKAEYRYKWWKQHEKQMFIVMDILGGDLYLNILTTDDEIDGYITKFINDEGTDARVLGVALDEKDTRAVPEYQVYISFQRFIFQMPLAKFGLKLADKMEDHLTATALCFVSDASIVLGLNLNNDLLIKSGTDVVS